MRRATLIAGGIAVAAAAWILSGQVTDKHTDPSGASNQVSGETETVDTPRQRPRVRITESTAIPHGQEFSLFGRTEADRIVYIRAETSGRVIKIHAKKGDEIEAGGRVVRLAMDDRAARLAEAEARVDFREIGYDAALSLAEKNFSAEVTVAGDLAELESARAALHAIQLDIARTHLVAPFEGIIEEVPLEVGDLVNVGDIVATLVDLDPITVVAEVSERQVAKVRVGQDAQVHFANGPARSGTVTFVSRRGRDETRTFRVEIEVSNSEFDVPQGLTTEVTLLTDSVMAHRISPAILTLNGNGQIGVKIIEGKAQVAFVPITIIAETMDGVWIYGLPRTARLITVGQEFVRSGQLVDAVDADKP